MEHEIQAVDVVQRIEHPFQRDVDVVAVGHHMQFRFVSFHLFLDDQIEMLVNLIDVFFLFLQQYQMLYTI